MGFLWGFLAFGAIAAISDLSTVGLTLTTRQLTFTALVLAVIGTVLAVAYSYTLLVVRPFVFILAAVFLSVLVYWLFI